MRILLFLTISFLARLPQTHAQQPTSLDSALQKLAKEKDPQQTLLEIDKIIKEHHLNRNTDSETLDMLYGTAAVNFAMQKNYSQFETYIDSIQNKFNQTSFMNMAASQMLNEGMDADYANKISAETLRLYHSFRNDTSAKPSHFSSEDWQRFMRFAQYPYYDTHAQSLMALENYTEALKYQKLAFDGEPEEGMPVSVARYTQLLQLTGHQKGAKELLLKRARLGKLNREMTEQLQSIYIEENGTDLTVGAYLDSLQKNVQAALVEELRPTILQVKAPAFSLMDIYGKRVKLSDFKNKIVVLDLWATWCVPCIASFPAMQMMVKKHPEVAFLFIAVQEQDEDPLPRVKSFIEKNKYPFTVLLDEPISPTQSQHKIISAYKPNGIPAKYIIDKKGMLRFTSSGFDTDTELINELEAMFTIINGL